MNGHQNWRLRAACRDEDPELFFPAAVNDTGLHQVQTDAAKQVCARCDVQQQCLTWSLDNEVTEGVFGGTSEVERQDMIRVRSRGSRKRRDRSVSEIDVQIILRELDDGIRLAPLQQKTGIDRHVLLRVWREHRDSHNPPGMNCTKAY